MSAYISKAIPSLWTTQANETLLIMMPYWAYIGASEPEQLATINVTINKSTLYQDTHQNDLSQSWIVSDFINNVD